jgi:hypothetical protein
MMLIRTLDSYSPPTDAQLAAAKAGGIGAWNGYLPGPSIDNTWHGGDFARIRAAGLQTIAYASGWADAAAMKALAASWGVIGCLDLEGGIRDTSAAWPAARVQAWLDVSGFGMYHSESGYHYYGAPFYVIAGGPAYRGGADPGVTWPAGTPRPPKPTGWQWQGSHSAFGANVDSSNFDSEIWGAPAGGITPLTDNEPMWLLYKVSGGDATEYVFTGAHVIPMNTQADIDALVANGNLASNIAKTISAQQHADFKAVGIASVTNVTNTGAPPASFKGTIVLTPA